MYRPKTINKQQKKKFEGKCYFCSETDYALLDVHRIVEGKDGGKYTENNSVICCANCHRKIHDNQTIIDRKYFSTSGYVLHFWDENGEHWQ